MAADVEPRVPIPPVQIRWENFRAFEDTGWIDIEPLTILIGANNSGKTSLLSPLLLLKQTLKSARARSPLVTRGDLINTGSYTDMVYGHDPDRQIGLSIRFHTHEPNGGIGPLGEEAPGAIRVTFKPAKAPGIIDLYSYEVEDMFLRPMISRVLQDNGNYSLSGLDDVVTADDQPNEETISDEAARQAIRDSSPDHFLFRGYSVLSAGLERATERPPATPSRNGKKKDRESARHGFEVGALELSESTTMYASIVEFVYGGMRKLLNDVVYIGPLRERPRRLYEVSGDAPPDVGTRGEYAPEILYRGRRSRLRKEVNRWLSRFYVDLELTCESLTETAFIMELRKKNGMPPTNFADTGFGISQILPLIVQGLYGPEDSLILAEQPEIHLNPRLQSGLADLFSSFVQQGRRVLVETHSEHLLLRLRRLVAEGLLKSSDLALYYIERSGDTSTVRNVPVQSNGHIQSEDWPAGFFEDSLREAFDLAAVQTRNKSA